GLVFDLHPSGTDGLVEEAETRFDAQADRLGWIVVYPDALAEGWQRYGCCGGAEEDVAFIAGVIARLEASDAVGPGRVDVHGTSRGGMMAYRLACELSDRLAAVAPVAGNMA